MEEIKPQNNGNNKNRNKMPRFNLTWLYVVIAVALGWLFFNSGDDNGGSASKNVTYTEFKQLWLRRTKARYGCT